MTDTTDKAIAGARAQLEAPQGNIVDRLVVLESVVRQLLDALEHTPRAMKGRP